MTLVGNRLRTDTLRTGTRKENFSSAVDVTGLGIDAYDSDNTMDLVQEDSGWEEYGGGRADYDSVVTVRKTIPIYSRRRVRLSSFVIETEPVSKYYSEAWNSGYCQFWNTPIRSKCGRPVYFDGGNRILKSRWEPSLQV